ncbi:hypothetical protein D3C80_2094150 [compost metagenome]
MQHDVAQGVDGALVVVHGSLGGVVDRVLVDLGVRVEEPGDQVVGHREAEGRERRRRAGAERTMR